MKLQHNNNNNSSPIDCMIHNYSSSNNNKSIEIPQSDNRKTYVKNDVEK